MTLDKRLSLIASYVRPGSRLADVGTDHALLPAALVAAGHCPRAIASDLRTGPVNAARLTVNAAGLEKRIDIRQGDGLAPLSAEEADDIVIAGMGGETIAGILDAAPWTKNGHFRFILQPMTRVGYLHRYLLQHGFSILREEAAEEAGRLYVVLLAQFTASPPAAEDDPKIWIGALSPYGLDKLYLQKQQQSMLKRAAGLRSRPSPSSGDEMEASFWENTAAVIQSYWEEST